MAKEPVRVLEIGEFVTMPPKKTVEMEKSLEGMQKEIGKIGAMEHEMGVMRSILEDIRKKMVEDEQRAAKAKAALQEEASGSVSEVVMQTCEEIPKEPSNLQSLEEWVIVQELVTMPPKKTEEMEKSLDRMQKEIKKIGAMEHEIGVMRSILEDIRKKMVEDEQRAAKAKAPLQEEASVSVSKVVMQTRKGIPKGPSNLQCLGERIIVQGLPIDEVSRKKMKDYDIHEWPSASQQSSVPKSPPGLHSTSARQVRIDGEEFTRQAWSCLTYEQFSAFATNLKELKARKQSVEETLRKVKEIFGTENNDLYVSFKGFVPKSMFI